MLKQSVQEAAPEPTQLSWLEGRWGEMASLHTEPPGEGQPLRPCPQCSRSAQGPGSDREFDTLPGESQKSLKEAYTWGLDFLVSFLEFTYKMMDQTV